MTDSSTNTTAGRSMLLVDDDQTFCQVLARAMRRRHFEVRVAHSVEQARQTLQEFIPDYAVVDLKMAGITGLNLIPELRAMNPAMGILMLTGYASIATAVEAIKAGATNYLCKPADADQILAACSGQHHEASVSTVASRPMSVDRLEWEHIQRVLLEHDGNISATARSLGMHRRTLQRKLGKHPVKV